MLLIRAFSRDSLAKALWPVSILKGGSGVRVAVGSAMVAVGETVLVAVKLAVLPMIKVGVIVGVDAIVASMVYVGVSEGTAEVWVASGVGT